ncbi:hypothetical protein [Streptomyces sp. NBC_01205]|uniref:hypothetical protein n=1 Tax=Streptomyces sp. NBC_01205 TaxID=2903771 RepID=UPI003FA39788
MFTGVREAAGDHGLQDHAAAVAAVDEAVPEQDELVLVGHSYAGLVVREAADARPRAVDHVVLLDGWAGPDGASLFSLAPDPFVTAVRTAAEAHGDGRLVPAPPPAAFGVVHPDDAAWLASRLLPPAAADLRRAHTPERRRRPDTRRRRPVQAADLPVRTVRRGTRVPDASPGRAARRDADRSEVARPHAPGDPLVREPEMRTPE